MQTDDGAVPVAHRTSGDEAARIGEALSAVLYALKRQVVDNNPATTFLLRFLRPGDPLRVSELAERCGLDVSTVSRHVKALEVDGSLARVEDPQDRRASLLRITERGTAVFDRAMADRARALGVAVDNWPNADRTALADLLTRLATGLSPLNPNRRSS